MNSENDSSSSSNFVGTHARKHLPTELVIRSRKGNTEFELNHREVLGSLRHTTFTVGDVHEIDSTVGGLFLGPLRQLRQDYRQTLLVHDNETVKAI